MSNNDGEDEEYRTATTSDRDDAGDYRPAADGGTPPAEAGQRTTDASQHAAASGLEPNLAGALSYALGWLTGLFFLFTEKDDEFVRFHAAQSIVAFGGFTVVYVLVTQLLWGLFWTAGGFGMLGLISLLTTLLSLVGLGLWIGLMYVAYQGRRYELPIAGKIASGLASNGGVPVERQPPSDR